MDPKKESKTSVMEISELEEHISKLERENKIFANRDRDKDDFVGNVSHELRTAVAPVRNVISNALAGVNGELDAKFRRSLLMADDNIKRLGVIIGDLLDVTRLESGRITIHRALMDPSRVLADTIATFGEEASRAGVTVDQRIETPPMMVFMDLNRIVQVISNLLNNAIKFTPWGGNISCKILLQSKTGKPLVKKELKDIPKGSAIAFQISDTGCGIPRDKIAIIFKRTGQAKAQSHNGETGLGLGLYISKQLVDLHGGQLNVVSKVDNGSTFTFTIPILEEEEIFRLSLKDRLTTSSIHQYETSIILLNLPGDEDAERGGEIIRGVLRRKSDTVICRGKGLFGIILPQTSGEENLAVIDRLRNAFEVSDDILVGENNDIQISSATFPDDGNGADELITTAEKNI